MKRPFHNLLNISIFIHQEEQHTFIAFKAIIALLHMKNTCLHPVLNRELCIPVIFCTLWARKEKQKKMFLHLATRPFITIQITTHQLELPGVLEFNGEMLWRQNCMCQVATQCKILFYQAILCIHTVNCGSSSWIIYVWWKKSPPGILSVTTRTRILAGFLTKCGHLWLLEPQPSIELIVSAGVILNPVPLLCSSEAISNKVQAEMSRKCAHSTLPCAVLLWRNCGHLCLFSKSS